MYLSSRDEYVPQAGLPMRAPVRHQTQPHLRGELEEKTKDALRPSIISPSIVLCSFPRLTLLCNKSLRITQSVRTFAPPPPRAGGGLILFRICNSRASPVCGRVSSALLSPPPLDGSPPRAWTPYGNTSTRRPRRAHPPATCACTH